MAVPYGKSQIPFVEMEVSNRGIDL
eukprot:COSAG02_NODE_68684_length_230_cov_5.633588_1_plen_24_part_10